MKTLENLKSFQEFRTSCNENFQEIGNSILNINNYKIVCGTYTGDGKEVRFIEIPECKGEIPEIVILAPSGILSSEGTNNLGGFTNGGFATKNYRTATHEIVAGGFTVYYGENYKFPTLSSDSSSQRYYYPRGNQKHLIYHYIVLIPIDHNIIVPSEV